ncbi:hypothetical protein Rsub_12779 [Raphidocelis subcapitata]|uniref:RAP domain-containing protein n=1 Tax=Raphidocelis subcapitata TaxID=307507 RepID=A0A2V0PJU7_9CHLO|nr:hypothetical protein Rsub_12779 [Raphidocelis subcapitata]|eukprot:GBG00082.1 hypothetical protein Rsub_12779 [Raphidocelis subcapitata]
MAPPRLHEMTRAIREAKSLAGLEAVLQDFEGAVEWDVTALSSALSRLIKLLYGSTQADVPRVVAIAQRLYGALGVDLGAGDFRHLSTALFAMGKMHLHVPAHLPPPQLYGQVVREVQSRLAGGAAAMLRGARAQPRVMEFTNAAWAIGVALVDTGLAQRAGLTGPSRPAAVVAALLDAAAWLVAEVPAAAMANAQNAGDALLAAGQLGVPLDPAVAQVMASILADPEQSGQASGQSLASGLLGVALLRHAGRGAPLGAEAVAALAEVAVPKVFKERARDIANLLRAIGLLATPLPDPSAPSAAPLLNPADAAARLLPALGRRVQASEGGCKWWDPARPHAVVAAAAFAAGAVLSADPAFTRELARRAADAAGDARHPPSLAAAADAAWGLARLGARGEHAARGQPAAAVAALLAAGARRAEVAALGSRAGDDAAAAAAASRAVDAACRLCGAAALACDPAAGAARGAVAALFAALPAPAAADGGGGGGAAAAYSEEQLCWLQSAALWAARAAAAPPCELPPALRAPAAAAWARRQSPEALSQEQRRVATEVHAALEALHLAALLEADDAPSPAPRLTVEPLLFPLTQDSNWMMHASAGGAAAGAPVSVALLVEGPGDRLALPAGALSGEAAAREAAITQLGWRVVGVAPREWDGLGGDADAQAAWLERRLAAAAAGEAGCGYDGGTPAAPQGAAGAGAPGPVAPPPPWWVPPPAAAAAAAGGFEVYEPPARDSAPLAGWGIDADAAGAPTGSGGGWDDDDGGGWHGNVSRSGGGNGGAAAAKDAPSFADWGMAAAVDYSAGNDPPSPLLTLPPLASRAEHEPRAAPGPPPAARLSPAAEQAKAVALAAAATAAAAGDSIGRHARHESLRACPAGRAIAEAASPAGVLAAVRETRAAGEMRGFHLASALHHLPKSALRAAGKSYGTLGAADRAALNGAAAELCPLLAPAERVAELGPRDAAMAIYGLGKANFKPPEPLLTRLAAHTAFVLLPSAAAAGHSPVRGCDAGHAAWGLGTLGLAGARLADSTLERALLGACARALVELLRARGRDVAFQDITDTLWGAAVLDQTLPAGAVATMVNYALDPVLLEGARPFALSKVLFALERFRTAESWGREGGPPPPVARAQWRALAEAYAAEVESGREVVVASVQKDFRSTLERMARPQRAPGGAPWRGDSPAVVSAAEAERWLGRVASAGARGLARGR